MYNLEKGPIGAGKCADPDWEKIYKDERSDFDAIVKFKESLHKFIRVIGTHSFINRSNNITELLGTIELDLIQRKEYINSVATKIEG